MPHSKLLKFQTIGHLRSGSLHLNLSPRTQLFLVNEPSLQRRAANRYKLRLPVIFSWNDGTEHTEGGFTNDIALDGALIFSSKCPPVGTNIRIEVLIPPPGEFDEELRIECVGKVVRVAEQAGCFGISGSFDDEHLTRHVLCLSN